MSSREFSYAKEERVYAFHGPLLYVAKVLDTAARTVPDTATKVKLYLLQYEGFDSHWDEWVPESRIMKDGKEAEALQKDRVKEFNRAQKRRSKQNAEAASSGAASSAASTKKQKTGDKVELMPMADIKEQLRLPQAMKLRLINDWERITREKRLVPLPRQPSIATLLDEFVATKAKRSSHERLYIEVCDGMRSYFNQALGTLLLYKYERKQYRDTRESFKDRSLVDVYGAEHLLRLFVKLPELLGHCKLQREHMTVLLAKLTELLKFMQANKTKYFLNTYESASDEYLEWWGNTSNE